MSCDYRVAPVSFVRVLHAILCAEAKKLTPSGRVVDAAISLVLLACSHKVNSQLRDHKPSGIRWFTTRLCCPANARVLFLVSEYRRERTSHRSREQNPYAITARTPNTRLALVNNDKNALPPVLEAPPRRRRGSTIRRASVDFNPRARLGIGGFEIRVICFINSGLS